MKSKKKQLQKSLSHIFDKNALRDDDDDEPIEDKKSKSSEPADYIRNPNYHTDKHWIIQLYLHFSMLCHYIVNERRYFSYFITFTIIASGILIGLETYFHHSSSNAMYVIRNIDIVILSIFFLEIFLKLCMEGLAPWRYFTGPDRMWNTFDFIIVILSVSISGGNSVAFLRLVRLARLGKLIHQVPVLEMIIKGLIDGVVSILPIMLLLVIVFYLFGIIGFYLFSVNDPFHFGNLAISMVTLFRVSVYDNCGDIMYLNTFGCSSYPDVYFPVNTTTTNEILWCKDPTTSNFIAPLFFVFYILIAAFVVLSLFVGAVSLSMASSLRELEMRQKDKLREKLFNKNLHRLRVIRRSNSQSGMDMVTGTGTSMADKIGGGGGNITNKNTPPQPQPQPKGFLNNMRPTLSSKNRVIGNNSSNNEIIMMARMKKCQSNNNMNTCANNSKSNLKDGIKNNSFNNFNASFRSSLNNDNQYMYDSTNSFLRFYGKCLQYLRQDPELEAIILRATSGNVLAVAMGWNIALEQEKDEAMKRGGGSSGGSALASASVRAKSFRKGFSQRINTSNTASNNTNTNTITTSVNGIRATTPTTARTAATISFSHHFSSPSSSSLPVNTADTKLTAAKVISSDNNNNNNFNTLPTAEAEAAAVAAVPKDEAALRVANRRRSYTAPPAPVIEVKDNNDNDDINILSTNNDNDYNNESGENKKQQQQYKAHSGSDVFATVALRANSRVRSGSDASDNNNDGVNNDNNSHYDGMTASAKSNFISTGRMSKQVSVRNLSGKQRHWFIRLYLTMTIYCHEIIHHRSWAMLIASIIVAGLIVVGLETNEMFMSVPIQVTVIQVLNNLFLSVFAVEIVLKMISHGFQPWVYFFSMWNIIDFVIVLGSFIPQTHIVINVIRMLKLQRVFRLARKFTQLSVIINALFISWLSVGYIALILFIHFYVFAILGMILFESSDPWHFGQFHIALITLLRVVTLDNAFEIIYINMYGCDVFPGSTYTNYPELCTHPIAYQWVSVLYFLSFIIMGCQVLLTLFIGVISTSLESSRSTRRKEMKLEGELAKRAAKLRLTSERVEAFRRVFIMLDLDEDGILEEDELQMGLDALNLAVPFEKFDEYLDIVDPHRDGLQIIGFIDFMSMLPSYRMSLGYLLHTFLKDQDSKIHSNNNNDDTTTAKGMIQNCQSKMHILLDILFGRADARLAALQTDAALTIQEYWAEYKIRKAERMRRLQEKRAAIVALQHKEARKLEREKKKQQEQLLQRRELKEQKLQQQQLTSTSVATTISDSNEVTNTTTNTTSADADTTIINTNNKHIPTTISNKNSTAVNNKPINYDSSSESSGNESNENANSNMSNGNNSNNYNTRTKVFDPNSLTAAATSNRRRRSSIEYTSEKRLARAMSNMSSILNVTLERRQSISTSIKNNMNHVIQNGMTSSKKNNNNSSSSNATSNTLHQSPQRQQWYSSQSSPVSSAPSSPSKPLLSSLSSFTSHQHNQQQPPSTTTSFFGDFMSRTHQPQQPLSSSPHNHHSNDEYTINRTISDARLNKSSRTKSARIFIDRILDTSNQVLSVLTLPLNDYAEENETNENRFNDIIDENEFGEEEEGEALLSSKLREAEIELERRRQENAREAKLIAELNAQYNNMTRNNQQLNGSSSKKGSDKKISDKSYS